MFRSLASRPLREELYGQPGAWTPSRWFHAWIKSFLDRASLCRMLKEHPILARGPATLLRRPMMILLYGALLCSAPRAECKKHKGRNKTKPGTGIGGKQRRRICASRLQWLQRNIALPNEARVNPTGLCTNHAPACCHLSPNHHNLRQQNQKRLRPLP